MSFTDAEKQKWLEEKRSLEKGIMSSSAEQAQTSQDMSEYAVCLHCNNPFRRSEGTVTPDAAICDTCNY